jgi:hypothetical protein
LAGRVRQIEDFLEGGVLTEVLTELGEVLSQSGLEHLREAATSPNPAARVGDAAADLQAAYIAFERAGARGLNRTLRRGVASLGVGQTRLSEPIGKAAAAAGAVAWLRFLLGEPPETQRKWLDRVAKHVTTFWYDTRQRGGSAFPHIPGDALGCALALSDYFHLERLLLPETLIRPLPPAWRGEPLSGSLVRSPTQPWTLRPQEVLPLVEDQDTGP